MKNLKLCLSAFISLLLNTNQLIGQFVPAAITELNYPLSVNGRATGNDILEKGGDVWEVTVYDDIGGNSGLAYNYNGSGGTFTGDLQLNSSDAYDCDVVLTVDGNGDIHAIVSFYSANAGGYTVDDYLWGGGTFNFSSSITFDVQPSFGTTVNIDGDYDAFFIIVWDVAGSLFAITGDVAGGIMALNNVVSIGTMPGIYPDVCFNNRGNDAVHYCYIDAFGDLQVESDSYSSLAAASFPVNIMSHSPQDTYILPRIACPDDANIGNAVDWTVVVLDTDVSSAYRIIGHNFNSINGLNSPIEYSNSAAWSVSGIDLKNDYNYYPVVTYDDQGNIFVGWNLTNTLGNIPGATSNSIYPIVLPCDLNGNPVPNQDYWDVPRNLSSLETKDIISLSGRQGVDVVFCSYYFLDNGDVETKAVYGSIALGSLKTSSILSEVVFDKSNDLVNSQLYDVSGKLILEYYGTFKDFVTYLDSKYTGGNISLFLIQVRNAEGSILLNSKYLAK